MHTKVIKLLLKPDAEQSVLLADMMEQYRSACNLVSQYVFDHDCDLSKQKLHDAMYRRLRTEYGLKSQMAESVFTTVIARYKAVREQLWQKPFRYFDTEDLDEDGKPKMKCITRTLEWLWKPIAFRRPQADLVSNRDYGFTAGMAKLSINTLGPRVKMGYVSKHWEPYLDGSWKLGTGKLVQAHGKWYFHIPVSKEIGNDFCREKPEHIVGIDRGLRFLVTAYDEQGKTAFVSGREVMAKREKFAKMRAELQSRHTWSAFRALKKLSGQENRWMSEVNHRMSKALVQKFGRGTLFVLEDLSGVSFDEDNLSRPKKQKRDLRSWAFYQMEQFLAYKAEENGSHVLKVPAAYTSQRCPKCGRILKENRDHGKHLYSCDKCGYRSNDDRVGAMNIFHLGELWTQGNDAPRYKKPNARRRAKA